MKKPEHKEHHISCKSDFDQPCDCGAKQWNLACEQWEEYVEENYSRKVRRRDEGKQAGAANTG